MTLRTNMKIEYREYITRKDLRNNPNKIYLFGDNLLKTGFGGQAKEMRNEPNAIGIPTKKKPFMSNDSFFSDNDFNAIKKILDEIFICIPHNVTIVIPKAGLGTGRAMLRENAPKIWKYLQLKLKQLETI